MAIDLTELEHAALVKALRDRAAGVRWLHDHSSVADSKKSYGSMAASLDALANKIEEQKSGAVREFVLHDGTNEAETEKLHEFLAGVEWDGEPEGVVLWTTVKVGDTIYRYPDGSVRVMRRAE